MPVLKFELYNDVILKEKLQFDACQIQIGRYLFTNTMFEHTNQKAVYHGDW